MRHASITDVEKKGGNMKNKRHNLVCMLVFATILSVAGTSLAKTQTQQSSGPDIEWIHTYGSILNDRAYCVEQTTDGGYIFTGSTVAVQPGYTDVLLLKTDANGDESWRAHFPVPQMHSYGTAVHQTTDGGYVMVGSTGYTWLWDVLVVKASANGNLIWQKSFGKSDGPDHGTDILQTSDGGYLVLADTSTYGQGGYDLWLIKLAADGTEQWNKTIGGPGFDLPTGFTETNDGYIIVGDTDAVDGNGDLWIVSTNDAGEVQWQKTFGDATFDRGAADVIAEANGGCTILGSTYDGNWTESIWVLHLDAQGTLTSEQFISGQGSLHGTSITKTTDGGYFITGVLTEPISCLSDAYLLKLSSQGVTEWEKTIDVSNGANDETTKGIQAKDGGYVAVGSTGNLNENAGSTFLMKLKAEWSVVLDSVTGRLGVQAHLKNLGTSEAPNVNVRIDVTGGLFHRINVSYQETLSIPAGGEATVSCKPFVGLGAIHITVTVNGVASTYEGKQLFILTKLVF